LSHEATERDNERKRKREGERNDERRSKNKENRCVKKNRVDVIFFLLVVFFKLV